MPLHFGKIFALIALLTIVAFVLWQLWIAIFAGETADPPNSFNLEGAPAISTASAG